MLKENSTKVELGDLVKCSWLDAFATAAENYDAEAIASATAHKITTYGVLIRDDRPNLGGLVGLATEITESGYYRGVTFVPVPMIVTVEPAFNLKKRATRKPKSPQTALESSSLPVQE